VSFHAIGSQKPSQVLIVKMHDELRVKMSFPPSNQTLNVGMFIKLVQDSILLCVSALAFTRCPVLCQSLIAKGCLSDGWIRVHSARYTYPNVPPPICSYTSYPARLGFLLSLLEEAHIQTDW
jgi:hypothetical protein